MTKAIKNCSQCSQKLSFMSFYDSQLYLNDNSSYLNSAQANTDFTVQNSSSEIREENSYKTQNRSTSGVFLENCEPTSCQITCRF